MVASGRDEPFIGIDLGTTNSCVGLWHNGSVESLTSGNIIGVSWNLLLLMIGDPAMMKMNLRICHPTDDLGNSLAGQGDGRPSMTRLT